MEGSSSSSKPSSSTHHDNDDQLLVDDLYFSAVYDEYVTNEIFPISDEKYAQELQLQEALYFSATTVAINKVVDEKPNTDQDTLLRTLKQKQKETGECESSRSQSYYCAICMEEKHVEEMFKNQNCSHSFCNDCVGVYLGAKIQENISMVKCPNPKCNGVLEPYQCSSIIPKDVFDRWETAFCENMVIGSKKFYCPFNDCSALLLNDEEEGVVVTSSECPHCHRLFCAQCKVAWHAGVDCKEFKNLKVGERGREDLMAMELAKKKSWKRCPTCNFYVEKVVGCTRITCRCGFQFCYGCGSSWSSDSHYSCALR